MPVCVEFRESFFEPHGRRAVFGPFGSVHFISTDGAIGLTAVQAGVGVPNAEHVLPVADLKADGTWKLYDELLLYGTADLAAGLAEAITWRAVMIAHTELYTEAAHG